VISARLAAGMDGGPDAARTRMQLRAAAGCRVPARQPAQTDSGADAGRLRARIGSHMAAPPTEDVTRPQAEASVPAPDRVREHGDQAGGLRAPRPRHRPALPDNEELGNDLSVAED
jgi:hypothetical protein